MIAPWFPPCANQVRVCLVHAERHWKGKILGNLQCFFFAIDGACNNADVEGFEIIQMCLVAG